MRIMFAELGDAMLDTFAMGGGAVLICAGVEIIKTIWEDRVKA